MQVTCAMCKEKRNATLLQWLKFLNPHLCDTCMKAMEKLGFTKLLNEMHTETWLKAREKILASNTFYKVE